MADANPTIGDPIQNLLHLIGEAITDDVEAWLPGETGPIAAPRFVLFVTRGGKTFRVTAVEVDDAP